jgi:hypothetical protein
MAAPGNGDGSSAIPFSNRARRFGRGEAAGRIAGRSLAIAPMRRAAAPPAQAVVGMAICQCLVASTAMEMMPAVTPTAAPQPSGLR